MTDVVRRHVLNARMCTPARSILGVKYALWALPTVQVEEDVMAASILVTG